MSGNGKYQTACCNGGKVGSSNDFGYTWVYSSIGPVNFSGIAMSKNGQYQTVCGVYDLDNSTLMYSKTYGSIWSFSIITDVIGWNDISISETGQYQIVCSNSRIYSSDNYGVNFTHVSYGDDKVWLSVSISLDGQRQLFCTETKIYISNNFGLTAEPVGKSELFPEGIAYENLTFGRLTSSLQYIIVLKDSGLMVSKIPNDLHIPGVITVNTKGYINSNAVILLSGSRQNIYSYRIINDKTFDIISSDFEDSGQCSYSVQSYGQYSE
jgi:hypothetical protein